MAAEINNTRKKSNSFRLRVLAFSTGIFAAGGILVHVFFSLSLSSRLIPCFCCPFAVCMRSMATKFSASSWNVHAVHSVFVCFRFSLFLLWRNSITDCRGASVQLKHADATTCDMWSWSRVACSNWKPLRLHSIKFTRNEWIATKEPPIKTEDGKKEPRHTTG